MSQPKKIYHKTYPDSRGFFRVIFESSDFDESLNFNQLLYVSSIKDVFRGMHIQLNESSQNKVFTVLKGTVLDFTINLIKSSKDYLKLNIIEMSDNSNFSLFIPNGYAHGYLVKSTESIVQYSIDKPLSKENYKSINFREESFGLKKYINFKNVIVSDKDDNGITLSEFEKLQK